jgi:putative transposase
MLLLQLLLNILRRLIRRKEGKMENKIKAVHNETVITPITCKNCNSNNVIKFGKYKGVQRYFCKDCDRKFKADGTQFHEKKSSQYISSAVSEYYRGMSINDIRSQLKQEYGYYPSKSVIFKWVNKYTDLARKQFQDCHPEVGDTWIADETMLDLDGQHKIWFYDVIDEKTRFLLASRVAASRTINQAQLVMEEAGKRAGKTPETVITDSNKSYMDGIYQAFKGNTEHIQSYPTAKENDTQRIERFHETLKDRTKVFKAFRDTETLIQFTDGWLVYYNYFKPHQSLKGKTPAEEAKVNYAIKNWADLARIPVAKQTEIESHKTPKVKIPKTKVNLDKALKRKRGPQHRGHEISIYDFPSITPKMPVITAKVGKLK